MNTKIQIKDKIKKLIADSLKMNVTEINDYDNLIESGVDSIILISIKSALKKEFQVDIQISQFFGGLNTVADLAEHVYNNSPKMPVELPSQSMVHSKVEETVQTASYKKIPPIEEGKHIWMKEMAEQLTSSIYQLVEGLVTRTAGAELILDEGDMSVESNILPEVLATEEPVAEAGPKTKAAYVPYKKIDTERKKRKQLIDQMICEATEEYNSKTQKSKEYAADIRVKHADWRNVAGFRLDMKEMVYQLVAKDCEGSKIFDIDGNEYIDIAMGFGVNLFGYKPPFILSAIEQEVHRGFPLSMISENLKDVSDLLCRLTGMERVSYFNSGSEAVMSAVRIARAQTGRNKIVIFAGAYHGTFDGVLGIPGETYKQTDPMAVGILSGIVEDLIILNYGDDAALEIIAKEAEYIAGVLVEPVQSRNPSLQPRQFVKKLRALTEEKEIALIFDEMITGFRISAGGAQQFYGIKADIATYGKIVGGGMPIGIVAGKAVYMDCLDGGAWNFGDMSYPPNEAKRTFAGGTFCHHPLALAAAKATLLEIEARQDTLYSELNSKTEYLTDTLQEYFDSNDIPIRMSHFGSLFRFETNASIEMFYYYMLLEGIYIWEGRNCFLSVAHTYEDVDKIIAAVKHVCAKMKGFFFEDKVKIGKQKNLPLNEQQHVMLSQILIKDAASQLHESVLLRVEGELNKKIFDKAVKKVIRRHDMLNVVCAQDHQYFQRLHQNVNSDVVKEVNLDHALSDADTRKLINSPFDIYSERLVRIFYVADMSEKYLLFTLHHLVADGWSVVLFIEEILAYYEEMLSGIGINTIMPIMDYSTYQEEKKKILDDAPKEEIVQFWETHLKGITALHLPQLNYKNTNNGKRVTKNVDFNTYDLIKQAAVQFKCSPFTLLFSAVEILLAGISDRSDFVIGTPFANQLLFPDFSILGNYNKIIPVPVRIRGNMPLHYVVEQNNLLFHRFAEYNYLFEELLGDAENIHIPDINVVFNMDTAPRMSLENIELKLCAIPIDKVMYDLMINIIQMDQELVIEFDYNSDKFAEVQVNNWLNSYLEIISQLISSQMNCVADIRYLSPEDESAMLSRVKHVVNYHADFHELLKYDVDEKNTFLVADENMRLLPVGSIRYVFLYSEKDGIVPTNWAGRITSKYELELFGPVKRRFKVNNRWIESWYLEYVIAQLSDVSKIDVFCDEDERVHAVLQFNDDTEKILQPILNHCMSRLSADQLPDHFHYLDNDTAVRFTEEFSNPLEERCFHICAEILNYDYFDKQTDLISIGMNSLQIIELFSMIQSEFQVKLGFKQFSTGMTVEKIADLLEESKGCGKHIEQIAKVENREYYDTSFPQKRMYIEYKLNQQSVIYNLPVIVYIKGRINEEKLIQSVFKVINRHEILRTYFKEIDGDIVQIISPEEVLEYEIVKRENEDYQRAIIEKEMNGFIRPFDLEKLPLLRVEIIQFADDINIILFDMHHIIFDGGSEKILFQEIMSIYEGDFLDNITIQYKDFSAWHNKFMDSDEMRKQEHFWQQKYPDKIPVMNLCTDHPRPPEVSYKGKRYSFCVDSKIAEGVKQVCSREKCTPFTFFLAVYCYTLKLYSDQTEVITGITLEGRNHFETLGMIGFFVNNLPFSISIDETHTVAQYLAEIKSIFYQIADHSDIQLDRIMELCKVDHSAQRHSVFDVNFNFQDFISMEQDNASSYEFHLEEYYQEGCMFDFECIIAHTGNTYQVIFEYCTDLFEEKTIERMADVFTSLVKQFSDKNSNHIKDLDICRLEDRSLILGRFNNTKVEYPKHKTVVDLFEEQVAAHPDDVALTFGSYDLTYTVLNSKANILAHTLRDMGIGRNECVGIMTNRSIEMVIAIYAVLKAGGAYVPIDSGYPEKKQNHMISNSDIRVLITNGVKYQGDVNIIDLTNYNWDNQAIENLKKVNHPSDLAYIIYTSGTTGNSKGVMIEHTAIVNYSNPNKYHIMNTAHLMKLKNIAAVTNITFDISVTEVITAMLNGMHVFLADTEEQEDAVKLYQFIKKNNIEILQSTPGRMKLLLSLGKKLRSIETLKYIMIGGEKVEPYIVSALHKYTTAVLQNVYGPSETTVWSTAYEIDRSFNLEQVPIGRPISNTQIYILNGLQLCGIGMQGELCIAGDGVARGYLKNQALTDRKFIDNPYGDGKLYCTGDYARWRPDGTIEYLGRMDEQVKIRGYRIELGEVEHAVRAIEGIKDVVASVQYNEEKEAALCVYIVSDQEMDNKFIQSELEKVLPYYMIPSYIGQLNKIPLNQSGKVDKRSLPKLRGRINREYVAPITQKQQSICRIYEEILQVEKVGIKENFFDLGGHSLNALRLINELKLHFGCSMELKTIFSCPTVEEMAAYIDNAADETYEEIKKAEYKDVYKMSSAQKRLYMLRQLDADGMAYNMNSVIKLNKAVDGEKVRNVMQSLIDRHEILRTQFVMDDSGAYQYIKDQVEVDFECCHDDSEIYQLMKAFVRPFDLEHAPLFRLKFVEREDENVLLFDMHHIIGDGFSLEILTDEFTQLLQGNLPDTEPLQYKDYSEWFDRRDLSIQKEFWLKRFDGNIPVLDMKTDFKRPQIMRYQGNRVSKAVDGQTVRKIRELCRNVGVTEYMVYLSAVNILLGKYARQDDIIIGTPVSGRTHRDTERILGVFVNTLAMRAYPEAEKEYLVFLKEVKEEVLLGLENQEYPFEELIDELKIQRDMSRNPLFDVMFTIENLGNELNDDETTTWREQWNDGISKFDLEFIISVQKDKHFVQLQYSTELFLNESAVRMLDHLLIIVNQVINNTNLKLKDIEVITEDEKHLICDKFNKPERLCLLGELKEEFSGQIAIDLFEKQVQQCPDRFALIMGNKKMTYVELDRKANSLAHMLKGMGIGAEDFVAIYAEKSMEMIVAAYAVLKAGGVYVPIDPIYPEGRISFILKDCAPKAVLTYGTQISCTVPVIDMEAEDIFQGDTSKPQYTNNPNHSVYCIYTSGTTGKPKGTLISNRSLVNLVYSYDEHFQLTPDDIVLLYSSFGFDSTVADIFPAGCRGAAVCIVPEDIRMNSDALTNYMNENRVTVAGFTPKLIELLDETRFPYLRIIESGGESGNLETLKRWARKHVALNVYGPTEATVNATIDIISQETDVLTIGKPILGCQAYILDSSERQCGIGITGELCLAGAGLAKEYINRPKLTKEKFTVNPFGKGRLYHTGDLARWLSSGKIECFGRIDEQVKIRGYRIELAEIEAVIRAFDEIEDVIVICRKDSADQDNLCAYLVGNVELDIMGIREKMRSELPEYMIPAFMMQIEQMPVTINGKLDKKSLPEIELTSTQKFVAPRTENEEVLCKVMSEVLGKETISVKDSFFELGGDSIKSIRAVSRLRESGFEITVRDILQYYTVEAIAVKMKKVDHTVSNDQYEVTGEIINTPILQKFIQCNYNSPHHYNQSVLVMTGIQEEKVIDKALAALVVHHDMLRCVFEQGRLRIRPISEGSHYQLNVYDLFESSNYMNEIETLSLEIQSSFVLTEGPLFKAGLFRCDKGNYLLLCIHHLIVDGLSWRILAEDFNTATDQIEAGHEICLPQKTASFKMWSKYLNEYRNSKQLRSELSYWTNVNHAVEEGRIRGLKPCSESGKGRCTLAFTEEQTTLLLLQTAKLFSLKTDEILICGLGMALNKFSGQDCIAIQLEGHGRQEIHKRIDIDRTVGWFTSYYPVVLKLGTDIRVNMTKTKDMLRRIPNHGIGYGLLIDISKQIQPDISFNYLGEVDAEFTDRSLFLEAVGKDIADDNNIDGMINFDSQILQNKLHFEVTYDKSKIKENDIIQITEHYQKAIMDILDYCSQDNEITISASDIEDSDVSSEDFNLITDLLGEIL